MITNTYWFTPINACIGIVQVVSEGEREMYRQTGRANFSYFIGTGKGKDEREDAVFIAEYGSRFSKVAGDALFGVEFIE